MKISMCSSRENKACSVRTRERLKGLLRNFNLSLLCVGVVNLSKSVAVVFQRGTHVMAISLTISLDYLPQT